MEIRGAPVLRAPTSSFSVEGDRCSDQVEVSSQSRANKTVAVPLSASSCSSVCSRGSQVSQRGLITGLHSSPDDTDAQTQGRWIDRAGSIDRSCRLREAPRQRRAVTRWQSGREIAQQPRRDSDRASKGSRHHQRRSRGVHRSSSRRKRRAPGSLIERCILRSWSPRQLSPRSLSPTVMRRSRSPDIFVRDKSSVSSEMGDGQGVLSRESQPRVCRSTRTSSPRGQGAPANAKAADQDGDGDDATVVADVAGGNFGNAGWMFLNCCVEGTSQPLSGRASDLLKSSPAMFVGLAGCDCDLEKKL